MATIITDNKHYQDIATAIRNKTGGSLTYMPGDMAAAITAIPTGSPLGVPGVNEKTVNNQKIAEFFGPVVYGLYAGATIDKIEVCDNTTTKINDGAFSNTQAGEILITAPITEVGKDWIYYATFNTLTFQNQSTAYLSKEGLLNDVNAPNGIVNIDCNFAKPGTSQKKGFFWSTGTNTRIKQITIKSPPSKTSISPYECYKTKATIISICEYPGITLIDSNSFRDAEVSTIVIGPECLKMSNAFYSSNSNSKLLNVFISKYCGTVSGSCFFNRSNVNIYTDAESKPSGWNNDLITRAKTVTYNTSLSDFKTTYGVQ